jgi:hypothetical protein
MNRYRTDVYDIEGLTRLATKLRSSGAPLEDVLRRLREEGASPIATMSVLARVLEISVTRAQEIVWSSATWSDQLPGHDATMSTVRRFIDTDLQEG